MALSDCEMCWHTPCVCGHEYKDWSETSKFQHAAMVIFGTNNHNITDAKSLVDAIVKNFPTSPDSSVFYHKKEQLSSNSIE